MGYPAAMMSAILRKFKRAPKADEAEASEPVAEKINKALPKAVSGREAVLTRRARLAAMDKQTEEE